MIVEAVAPEEQAPARVVDGLGAGITRLRVMARSYRALIRRPDRDGAAAVENLLDEAKLEAERLAGGGSGMIMWSRLVERAERERAAPGLLYVLAAQAALTVGDAEAGLRLARAAVGADQLDTRAQGLFAQALAARTGQAVHADEDLSGLFCPRPFEDFEVRSNGEVYTCCASWLPVPIGDYREQAPDAIWNSPAAREVRRSILDGDFRYCSRLLCPLIVDRRLPRREEVTNPRHKEIIEQRRTYVPWRPRRVLMSQDRTCNLSCPSCRTSVFTARKDEQDRLNALFDKTILPLLADARRVKMCGSGDPLASGHFRHVLKRLDRRDHPRLEVELQTNGLLLDRRAWRELGLEGLVDSIWVSIDAATPETYAVVRRGGELGRLLDNLAYLSELRGRGRLRLLRLDFVVQGRNYREMPAAVEIGRAFGCDIVHFQVVRNWGTFGPAEFARAFIASPDHPEYEDFIAVLRHPNLGLPLVDLGELRRTRDAAMVASCLPAEAA